MKEKKNDAVVPETNERKKFMAQYRRAVVDSNGLMTLPGITMTLFGKGVKGAFNLIRSGSDKEFETFLGKEIIKVIEDINPNLHDITKKFLSIKDGVSIDGMYQEIKPLLDTLFNKKIGGFGVSLNEMGIQRDYLSEAFIKQEILPIVAVLRDIPKFCKSIKDKDILGKLNDVKSQLHAHLEHDVHFEVRKHLRAKNDGFYAVHDNDPALVSQIKKILNAIQHVEKSLLFTNNLDLNPDSGFKLESLLQKKGTKQVHFMARVVWELAIKDSPLGQQLHFNFDLEESERKFIDDVEELIQHAHEAQSSLFEIDIPMYQVFVQELYGIGEIIQSLHAFTGPNRNEVEGKLKNLDRVTQTVGDYVGQSLGTFIDQLKPHAGKADYSFLIRHSGLLPGYLDKLTQLIRVYGAGEPSSALALDPTETETFKNSAINLFLELDGFDDLFLFQKGTSLLFPVRKEGVTLGQGAYQQVQRVQDATGEMIVYQLNRIKHDVFARILRESDKIEQYSGLVPGVISKPLMQQLNKMYQTMVVYANSIIDLKEKHPDLLQLDNASFLIQRLQHILQQKNECELKVKEAEEAKQAIISFKSQIESIPNHDVTTISTEQLDALNRKYQQFKRFVINYNPKLSVLLDQQFVVTLTMTADINLMLQNVLNQCNKEIATYICYIGMADAQLTALPKQTKESLYALDPSKVHSILIINEPVWLNGRSILDNTEQPEAHHFSERHQFITDLTMKEGSDRAKLYHDHRTRSLTLQFIHHEIELFQKQLENYDWIDERIKLNAIIERYRVIQPYLVDSLEPNEMIDPECVELFVQLTQNIKLPDLSNIKRIITILRSNYLKKLDTIVLDESKRSEYRQLLFQFSHQKELERKTTLFGDAPLTLESELVKRQDKWIRHQRLSKASAGIKGTLYNLLSIFDPALNLDKVKQSTMVPFPEMENSLEALEMPRQMSWIKRTLNVVHYLNSSFEYLESLDRNIRKKTVTQYFLKGPLIDGIYQIKPYIEISKAYQALMELIQDPVGQQFFYALKDNYGTLQDIWTQLSPLYAASSESVSVDNPNPVEIKGFWYPMLSLMVVPEHLKTLSTGKTYGRTQAESAQQEAKKMSQYIEEVIHSFQAGQYFQLFLKSPYMLFNFLPQLKDKLDTFRQSTHKITLSHLKDIQAVLQEALVATDEWEIKLGLRAGSMSAPMKKILDQLFNRFIEPLGLSLKVRAGLVTNVVSFNKRLSAIEQKQQTQSKIVEAEYQAFKSLDEFLNIIEGIKDRLDLNQGIPSTEQFIQKYWAIYPLLQSQQSRYELAMDQRDKSEALDRFCNHCLITNLNADTVAGNAHHYPQLKNILHLVKHVRASKIGNLNTLKVTRDHLNSQALLIENAKKEDEVAEKERLKECVHLVIETQMEAIFKRVNQSFYLKSEYKRELYTSLRTTERKILAKAQTCPIHKMEQMITDELQAQLYVFSKKEHIQLCQLESIISSIERFMLYCRRESLNPIYESAETLAVKLSLLKHLKDIVNDDSQPLNDRLDKVKKEAECASFRTILMAHESHFKGDLKSLIRLIIDLLHPILNFFGELQRPQDFCESLSQEIKGNKLMAKRSLSFHMGLFPRTPDDPIGSPSKTKSNQVK